MNINPAVLVILIPVGFVLTLYLTQWIMWRVMKWLGIWE